MTAASHVPVLIAGAGPVGLTLAADLGWRGVPCLVVEERTETTDNPRCNTTNARSMEHYRRLGVADSIRRAGLPLDHPTDVVYCTSITGHELTRFRFSSAADVLAGRAPETADWPTPEPQHRISQIFLEPILDTHARGLPGVDVRRGHRLEYAEQGGHEVRATVRDTRTGETYSVTADYLVGCDGGSSTVRRVIGASLQGDSEVSDRRLSLFFRSEALGAMLGPRPGWMYWWYGPRFRGTLVRIDGEHRFLCHIRVPRGEDPHTADPHVGLRAALGRDVPYETLQVVRWTARRLVADRFRDRRILLAGDAAHLWLPAGGFGMNTGIADATGLAWRLAALIGGWGGDRLLDDYATERRSVGEGTSAAAVRLDADMYDIAREPELHSDTAAGARLRTEIGRRIERTDRKQWYSQGVQLGYRYTATPGIAATGEAAEAIATIDRYVPSVAPGARLPHFWRTDGSAIFDHLGPGLTIIRAGADAPDTTALADAARRRAVPLTTLSVTEPEVRELYETALVLVRPDQHVAWSGDEPPADWGVLLDGLLSLTPSSVRSAP